MDSHDSNADNEGLDPQADYPRTTLPPRRWHPNLEKVGCGCGLMLLSPILLFPAGAMLMAEGPHGPNGEITADPAIYHRGMLLTFFALALFIVGLTFLVIGLASRRSS